VHILIDPTYLCGPLTVSPQGARCNGIRCFGVLTWMKMKVTYIRKDEIVATDKSTKGIICSFASKQISTSIK
jgi:hypothetical protein